MSNDAAALMKAYELGANKGLLIDQEGNQHVLLPPEWDTKQVFRETLANPKLFKGTVNFATVESLARYTLEFTNLSPKAYAEQGRIVVVLNDHQAKPGYRDFVATFTPTHTEEWRTWIGLAGSQMSQAAFADFIEDNLEDVVEPKGSTMFEIVTTLQSHSSHEFKSAVDLQNGGRQLVWEESEKASAGKNGQLEVPRDFKVSIPIFKDNAAKATLTAKLRFRKKDGGLSFHYKLIRPEKAIGTVMAAFRKQFQELCPEVPFFLV